MATDGASVCVRVCDTFSVALRNRNEHIISRVSQLIGCCAGGSGQGDINLHTQNFKNNHAATVHTTTTAAVQQHPRFKLWHL